MTTTPPPDDTSPVSVLAGMRREALLRRLADVEGERAAIVALRRALGARERAARRREERSARKPEVVK